MATSAAVVVVGLGNFAETAGGAGMRLAGWQAVEEKEGIAAVLVVGYSLSEAGEYPCAGLAAAAEMVACASLPRTCCAWRRQT